MKKFFLQIFLTLFFTSYLFANNLQKVTLQLQWKHQFQFAGYYIAKEKGFYKELGLNVVINELKSDIDILKYVLNNEHTYATGRSSLIINKSFGEKVVLLASILQSSPHVLLAIEESNIKSIKDFKNKRIMLANNEKDEITLKSMMFSKGLSLDQLVIQEHSFNSDDLINKKVDLMSAYISNEPFLLKEKGYKSIIFDPKDYGFDFYNDILFTSQKNVENNNEEVRRFKEASLKGWIYAFNNIEETVNLIKKKYNTQNKSKEALLYEAKELRKLAFYQTNTLGEIQGEKIKRIFDYYNLMGYTKDKINLDEFIFDYNKENKKNIYLTDEEIAYLNKRSSIPICIDPNWMPFEAIDKSGKFTGISSDYFKIFSELLNKNFNVVKTVSWTQSLEYAKKRKCDILPIAMQTPERKKYMNFTTAYLKVPLIIATQINTPFIDNLQLLKNKKVAIPKGYAFAEILKNKYPDLEIIEVENIEEGLTSVSKNKVFGYIGTLPSVGYQFQTNYNGELKIAGKFDEYWELGIGVRNDDNTLLNIMQKAVDRVTPKEQQNILNNWISIKYENRTDYNLIFKILFITILIISIFIYWNRKLEKSKKQLEEISITDPLTQVYNRLYLDKSYDYEVQRVKRYNNSFSIILIDIDHFKNINDTYGHSIGDEILKEIATILKENIRQTDKLGRWGGEEFLIICPQTNDEKARILAENLKTIFSHHKFPSIENLTCSFGVSMYDMNAKHDKTFSKADKALYIAKNNGRNKVVVY
ncbi:diguanylate cyclase [Arcobacter sp.]|uniref:diguanylate cyclase n=1 Tax=Arcobacter sp. TaxID=1872629 RepID=UPI003D0ED0FA